MWNRFLLNPETQSVITTRQSDIKHVSCLLDLAPVINYLLGILICFVYDQTRTLSEWNVYGWNNYTRCWINSRLTPWNIVQKEIQLLWGGFHLTLNFYLEVYE